MSCRTRSGKSCGFNSVLGKDAQEQRPRFVPGNEEQERLTAQVQPRKPHNEDLLIPIPRNRDLNGIWAASKAANYNTDLYLKSTPAAAA
jgi:hypothetical protein